MASIDVEICVPDLLIDHPELLNVFQELRIEYTCGGKSLRAACEQRGLVLGEVVRLCEERLGESSL